MNSAPAIKWSGSKRYQAPTILTYFPKNIDTYYEPFVGGGFVMYSLLHSDIEVKNIICSDVNLDLINLWNEIKNNPNELVDKYTLMWSELNKDDNIARKQKYYNKIRSRYNKFRDPADFLFINRTTTNGLIRYNKKGEFNNSFHLTRKGMHPKTLSNILKEWSAKLNERNVQFICQDYKEITTTSRDFLYLDPPYANTKGMYFGNIDYEQYWSWLREQNCNYLFSFDGQAGDSDFTYSVPADVYTEHIYLENGKSSFRLITKGEAVIVRESLYIKTFR